MSPYSIRTKLALCALALLLPMGALLAQTGGTAPEAQPRAAFTPPDAATFGNTLESGDIARLRAWLDAGLDPDYTADRIGTGLMIAAWRGDIPMMELLVERGADVNRANALGETALMHAAWRGHAPSVKWLLARGARVNSDPMHWSALHYAVFAGNGEVAAVLLQNGADINARSTNGSSVLMMAVYEGHETLARELLAQGADRSIKNDRGDGALEWAFRFKRLSIARLVASPEEFVAAANQPSAKWGEPVRSVSLASGTPLEAGPASAITAQIDELLRMRNILASRGMMDAAGKLDRRIAALRAKRAREDRNTPPVAVLEISASRASPGDQRTRLLFEPGGPPP